MNKEHPLNRAIFYQQQECEGCQRESGTGTNKEISEDDTNVVIECVNYKEYVTVPSKHLGLNKINGKKVKEFLANPEFL